MDEPKIVSSYGETDDVNILPVDQEATLSCEVNSAPPADTFEWIKDNVLVDSEVYQTYNIANAEWSDSGDYAKLKKSFKYIYFNLILNQIIDKVFGLDL